MNTRILELLTTFPTSGNWFYVFDAQGTPVGDVSFLTLCFLKAIAWLWACCDITQMTGIEATPQHILYVGYALLGLILAGVMIILSWNLFGRIKYALLSVVLFATTVGVFTTFYANIQTLLFTTLTLIAVWCVYSGYCAIFAPVRLVCGFLFAVAATVTGGPLGFVIPFIVGLFSLIWNKGKGRIHSWDGVFAFGISFALLVLWVFWLVFPDENRNIATAMQNFVLSQFGFPDFTTLDPLDLLKKTLFFTAPWLILLLCIPYERAGQMAASVGEARIARPMAALPYVLLIVGLVSVLCTWKSVEYSAPITMLAYAIIGARIFMAMGRKRLNFALILLLLTVIGLAISYALPHVTASLPSVDTSIFSGIGDAFASFGEWISNLIK